MSLPLRLTIYFLITIALVAWLSYTWDRAFAVGGGVAGYIIVGSLLTLLNLIVRPILQVITAPIHFLVTILAVIIVNGVFMIIIHRFSLLFDASVVTLTITGFSGWVGTAVIFGLAHWALKELLLR